MKVLITGGAGFIGSHLAEELLLTHEVCVLDDGVFGRRHGGSLRRRRRQRCGGETGGHEQRSDGAGGDHWLAS